MSTSTQDQLLTANPFPGLRPFNIEESHLFFGREGQSDEVLLKLSKSRFVAVIGPSGSGKSSFIYCGVMPILYGGFLTDASPNWEVVVTRPGAGPIDNLAESLLKNNPEYAVADPEEKKIKRTIFSTLLKSSSLGLVEAIEQSRRNKDVNYLVLVDQFEELFTLAKDDAINQTFVATLLAARSHPALRVVIIVRADMRAERERLWAAMARELAHERGKIHLAAVARQNQDFRPALFQCRGAGGIARGACDERPRAEHAGRGRRLQPAVHHDAQRLPRRFHFAHRELRIVVLHRADTGQHRTGARPPAMTVAARMERLDRRPTRPRRRRP